MAGEEPQLLDRLCDAGIVASVVVAAFVAVREAAFFSRIIANSARTRITSSSMEMRSPTIALARMRIEACCISIPTLSSTGSKHSSCALIRIRHSASIIDELEDGPCGRKKERCR